MFSTIFSHVRTLLFSSTYSTIFSHVHHHYLPRKTLFSSTSSSSLSASESYVGQRPKPSSLISTSCLSIPGYFTKTADSISSSSYLSALPCFTMPGLPLCYSNSLSITCSLHDVSCLCPLFFIVIVFNFGLLLNSWCSLTISHCYAKHYSLHSPFGTLKFSFRGFR